MPEIIIFIAEIIGTVAFAISGASVAIKKNLDLFGVLVLGLVTSCGGGLLRDLILGSGIPQMFINPVYVFVSLGTSLGVFILCALTRKRAFPYASNIINVFDALGLGTFVVVGADVAIQLNYGDNALLVIFVSVLTGVGGGILRDILVGSIPAVLRKHIYAIASLIGALIYYGFYLLGLPIPLGMCLSVAVVVIIRILASKYHWSLPKIKNM